MKKVVLSVAIMSFALLANAQVLKKDLLKDYKPGDQLEKLFMVIRKSRFVPIPGMGRFPLIRWKE